jgi:hypothetical protein
MARSISSSSAPEPLSHQRPRPPAREADDTGVAGPKLTELACAELTRRDEIANPRRALRSGARAV